MGQRQFEELGEVLAGVTQAAHPAAKGGEKQMGFAVSGKVG